MSDLQASDNGIAVSTAGWNSPVTIIQQIGQIPSLLTPLLQGIVDVYEPYSYIPDGPHTSPETETKISYNCVNIYADDIRDSSGLMSMIENIINEIDNNKPNSKDKFLYAIKQKYTSCKNKLLISSNIDLSNPVEIKTIISKNADHLIYSVLEEIFSTVNVDKACSVELLKAAQSLIVCYGFINCKILEDPDDN
ncbi:hypothetical protein [Photobacterium phosphoreum]|uniref:hypothetical protein n=1 Tax=Photobacterium phosphoreum TaxID=659 RepID=UPI001E4A19E2|nr:hypothetical protein [Photobacterium phosphoreum]MCD9479349.1 hypothetical protein [Photobacterium phosphoreum]MCD9517820.1 hypothetical protein [Photobacterium phosphoreum]